MAAGIYAYNLVNLRVFEDPMFNLGQITSKVLITERPVAENIKFIITKSVFPKLMTVNALVYSLN